MSFFIRLQWLGIVLESRYLQEFYIYCVTKIVLGRESKNRTSNLKTIVQYCPQCGSTNDVNDEGSRRLFNTLG